MGRAAEEYRATAGEGEIVTKKGPRRRLPKAPARLKKAQPKRYVVLRRYFDVDDDTFKYESGYTTEVGLDYDTALMLAKEEAEKAKGGCFFVAQLVARAETIVTVDYQMEEFDDA